MKRTAFDESRDQRVANETGRSASLMCRAHGCPNLWSTSIGNLCRWHAASEPHYWPEITREQQDAETDRAVYASAERREVYTQPMTLAEKRAIADRMRVALDAARKNPRAWIGRLQERAAAGEPMTAGQKQALACVESHRMGLGAEQ